MYPYDYGTTAPLLNPLCLPTHRCRSAYNIFYQAERLRILASIPDKEDSCSSGRRRKAHGKIGFQDLAKSIATAWKALDTEARAEYVEAAQCDKERYLREKAEWQDYVARLEKVHSSGNLDLRSVRATNLYPRANAVIAPSVSPSSWMSFDIQPTPIPLQLPRRALHEDMDIRDIRGDISVDSTQNTRGQGMQFSIVERRSLVEVSRLLGPEGCSFIISTFS